MIRGLKDKAITISQVLFATVILGAFADDELVLISWWLDAKIAAGPRASEVPPEGAVAESSGMLSCSFGLPKALDSP